MSEVLSEIYDVIKDDRYEVSITFEVTSYWKIILLNPNKDTCIVINDKDLENGFGKLLTYVKCKFGS